MSLAQSLEATLVRLAISVFRRVGPVASSNIMGASLRFIGPVLPVSRVARANLSRALPELSPDTRTMILRQTWETLGRTAGEFVHVGSLQLTPHGPGLEITGAEHVTGLRGRAILVSAHLGNWEVLARIAALHGIPLATFYRAASNPAVDRIVVELRTAANLGAPGFPKGAPGARSAVAWLRQDRPLGLLVDQKLNEGIRARLFGVPAMTSTAAASFALRFKCPVLPVHVVRIGPARLRVICEAPLQHPATGDHDADIAVLTQTINDRLEEWVRAHPGQWLWLHRRWPDES